MTSHMAHCSTARVSAAPVEVLVVGAGPSGLFAAVELARHGVSPRVIEREPEPHRQARATALQPGTLEILAQAGLLDECSRRLSTCRSRGCSTRTSDW
jgi:2-polyprenyl-6-methoxyphenol hydroxylase-like FAD-dependent oxidoreductase